MRLLFGARPGGPGTLHFSVATLLAMVLLPSSLQGSDCVWNGSVSSEWTNPANWSSCNGTKPQPADTAAIPPAGNEPVIVGSETIGAFTVTGTLNVSGSLTVTGAATLDGGLGGLGEVTIAALLTWTSGTMVGGVTNANGGILLSGGPARSLSGRTLANAGAATMSGSASLVLSGEAIFDNQPSGILEIQNDGGLSGSGILNNAGTLNRTTSSGVATIGVAVNNSGSVHVLTGTLSLAGGGAHSGVFDFPSATLEFGGGVHTLGPASSVSGANVRLSGGTVNAAGGYAVFGTTTASGATAVFMPTATVTNIGSVLLISEGTITLDSGGPIAPATLLITGGVLTGSDAVSVSGLFVWTGGRMAGPGVTNANGGLEFFPSTKILEGRTLNNASSAVMNGEGNRVILMAGAVFANLETGSVDIQNTGGSASGFVGDGTFRNAGSLRTSGTVTFEGDVMFDSSGSVEVASGTLSLFGPVAATGSFDFVGAVLALGATYGLGAERPRTLNGPVIGSELSIGSGTTTINGRLDISIATRITNFLGTSRLILTAAADIVSLGPTVEVGGTTAHLNLITGELRSFQDLHLHGLGVIDGPDDVAVQGLFEWEGGEVSGSGSLDIADTGGLQASSGILRRPLENAGDIFITGDLDVGASAIANLPGARMAIEDGRILSDSPDAVLDNAGEMFVTEVDGEVEVQIPLRNTGTITFSGFNLRVRAFRQTAGAVHLSNAEATQIQGLFRFDGGVIDGSGGFDGDVLATGTTAISPGFFSPGAISVGGRYTQSSTVNLDLEANGTGLAQRDHFGSNGLTNIGGAKLNLTLGFTPSVGTVLEPISSNPFLGEFGTLNLPGLPNGLVWAPQYYHSALWLRVQTLVAAKPLRVDWHAAPGTSSDLNGVLDPGETVSVETTWRNPTGSPILLSGTTLPFPPIGPPGATYTITKTDATYGTIMPGAVANCFDATGNCFALFVSDPPDRRVQHWDVTIDETVDGDNKATWKIHIGGSFTDVARSSSSYRFIERVFHHGITAGCGSGVFCPTSAVTRAQMAVFLLRGKHGSGFVPPLARGTVFGDVAASFFAADFVEALAAEGITSGCGGGNYCPNGAVSRGQMAVLLLRAKHGSGYVPPAASGLFADVSPSDPLAPWIEQLSAEGITAGCGGGNYCPNDSVTRGQMAVFLSKTFGLD